MGIAPGHGRKQHFDGVRQQAARVGVVVRFGGWHELHELGVPPNRRQQVPLPNGLGLVRLAPDLGYSPLCADGGQQLLGIEHAQPSGLTARDVDLVWVECQVLSACRYWRVGQRQRACRRRLHGLCLAPGHHGKQL